MSFGLDYPVITTGNVLTTIDSYVANATGNINGTQTLTNGALNTPGALYQTQPSPATISANGVGSPRFLKYVRYNPTTTQVILTGPTLMYWKDETFTVVTGLAAEAFGSINNIAGWLLPNSTASAANTAANMNGNWMWMHVGGFLAGAWVTTAAAAGASVYGLGTTYGATGGVASGAAQLQRVAGYALAAAASNLVDLYVPLLN